MPDDNELISPGYLKIESLQLDAPHAGQKIDISRIIEEFTIYENVQQPFMSANFLINDVTSLFTLFPLTGDEFIHVVASIPHPAYPKKIDMKFRVVSIKDLQPTEQVRNVRYILRCLQVEAFKDWTVKVRKSYAQMPISEMAKKVCKDYLGIQTLDAETTTGTRTIVIPTMTPTQALHFLSREAKSANNAPSNYVFFSNLDGYHFKTVEEYLKKTPADKYFLTEKNYFPNDSLMCSAPGLVGGITIGQIQNAVNGTTKPFEFMKVSNYVFKNLFDLENNLRRGSFDTTIFAIDTTTCRFEKKVYNYKADYAKFQRADKTGAKYVFENSELNNLKGESHQRYFMSDHDGNKSTPDQKHEFLHYLAGSVAMLDYVSLQLTVPGDTTRRVGDVVRVGFPEFSAFDETITKENAFLSGDYLVTGVKHTYSIVAPGYTCDLLLVKNCYHTRPEDAKKPMSNSLGAASFDEAGFNNVTPTEPNIPVDIGPNIPIT